MLIKNGNVYWRGEIKSFDILLKDGKIKQIGKIPGKPDIDAKGLLILPGLIDPHVHLRDPGATHKEDLLSGTKAAIAGGFTTVLDMPNNPIPTLSVKDLREKLSLSEKALCNVYFYIGADGKNIKEINVREAIGLKIYMGKTTGGLLIRDFRTLWEYFKHFDRGKPIALHCEDQEVLDVKDDALASWVAVAKATFLAEREKRKAYLCHLTTALEINIAKSSEHTFVEVTPHHLFLSEKNKLDFLKSVRPPLRTEEERKKLWTVLDKTDCVGSDHAPHTLDEKKQGANGFPGLETSFHLFLDGWNKKQISLQWVVSRMAESPARVFGLKGKGKIERGYDADIILVDRRKEWKVKGDELYTKCKWSPFEGRVLKGKVVKTIVKGKLVYSKN